MEVASSTEKQTIGSGWDHVEKEKKGQKDAGLGMQIRRERGSI